MIPHEIVPLLIFTTLLLTILLLIKLIRLAIDTNHWPNNYSAKPFKIYEPTDWFSLVRGFLGVVAGVCLLMLGFR